MPEGQYTGTKKVYEYESENSTTKYLLQLDSTLGDISGCDLTEATESSTALPAPKRFKPRVVYWEGTLGTRKVRKRLVCGTVTATNYATNKSVKITIDGVEGFTTGRRGEKLTFLRLNKDADP